MAGLYQSTGAHPARHRPKSSEIAEECSVALNASALHDLVGPANQIRSMADLILKKYGDTLDDDARMLFGFLTESSDRLQNLLSGLRSYIRIVDRQEPHRHFDANDTLRGALATIQGDIDQNGAEVTQDPLPGLYGDPNQICFIFSALIENAIKFRSQRTPQIHVSAVLDGSDWLFSVSDNGIGVDSRHCQSIFGIFNRVHRDRYPGSGMGLAATARILRQHGGSIWVESSPESGATFTFALPHSAIPADVVAPPE